MNKSEAIKRYGILEGQLTLHQDRGSPMTAHGYLENMKEVDITCSHSRPRVSNDNPFSESQFKTQKYQPDYPGRFEEGSLIGDHVNFPTLTAAGYVRAK